MVTAENLPWNVVYDFIMDRLRAVRQDMVIQNLSGADYVSLLQPMIRFYAFAAYKYLYKKIKFLHCYYCDKFLLGYAKQVETFLIL